ncbi:MAG TPA: hypothetical protein VLF66_08070 [Thermoanaerobaculia bacterium]|nr:hypothetical protein [Thermoanaerobaculia bacterium]
MDGEPRPVVGVEAPDEGGPWRIVLYFDLALSDEHQVAWAAEVLSARLPELLAAGEVELVVADPEPRTAVPAPADAEVLAEALGRLALLPRGDDVLVEHRLGVLRELEAPDDPAAVPPEAWEALAAEEAALVRSSLDALLLALAERSGDGSARRCVLLATGGFDLGAPWLPAEPAPASTLGEETVAGLGRTLAAYGWLAVPLLAPPASGTTPGWRLGKWRIQGLLATYEEDRDPERAEAYLALAEARRDQGELDGAADAARKALVHFADDPRTAERQAKTLVLLGEVHEAQGEAQKARRVWRRALRRDPDALAGHPVTRALPTAPEEALGRLAAGTGGQVARSEHDLAGALHGLDRWGAVTVQLPGLPDGALHPVEVAQTGRGPAGRLETPGWLRFGTPEAVAEARIRRLLEGHPAGELEVEAVLVPADPSGSAGGAPSLEIMVGQGPTDTTPTVLRLTAILGTAEGEPQVHHLGTHELPTTPEATLTLPLPSAIPPEWGLLQAEDLLTGAWGATLLGVSD